MKKQILKLTMMICALALMTNVNAQKLSKKAQDAVKQEVTEMAQVMDLSQDQQNQMIELKTQLRLKNAKASKEHAKGSQELKDVRKANMQAYMADMKKVCTKEQMAKWQKHKKAQKNK
ncbi:hypothetical protein KDU71_02835 [Carboxylicivirga sediminis]|uniref:DUF4890 domain-containing protein n=1 Tax=Carboxylicivirga sediminis TaxID=2006564 RepID=A0A941ITU6_9BACT|nr:hypothetical protein [Carboxylicivirga sediminis]MBR8534481.1 hypothetical protein [Carboxylicivirga sediminis]